MLLNRLDEENEQTIAATVQRGATANEEKNWTVARDCFLQAVYYFSTSDGKQKEFYFALTQLAAALTSLQNFWAAIYITNRIIHLLQDKQQPNYILARLNRAKLYDGLQQWHLAKPDHEWLVANGNLPPHEKFHSRSRLCWLAKKQRRYDDYVKESIAVEKILAQLPDATDQQRHGLEKFQMFSYLQKGDYKNGFAYYENRFHFAGDGFQRKPYQRDDNKIDFKIADNLEMVKDKILLVAGDQGLGDNIMFARFLPLLQNMVGNHCKKIIFMPRQEQADFFANNDFLKNIEVMKTDGENFDNMAAPIFDHWLQLTSLPFHLGIDVNLDAGVDGGIGGKKMPYVDIPYLQYPAVKKNLPPHDPKKKNIGLVWATGKLGEGANERSIDLPAMTPILSCAANFFSFQLGERQPDIARHGLQSIIHDLSPLIGNFTDTASLLQNIDLVVSVDSSLTHLAAGLGKKTFLLSPYMTDWKWRDHHHKESDWYPKVIKIFHQTQENTWQGDVLDVKNNIDRFLKNAS